jgi:acyl-CoA reductase-like NAD-dependent aldehyde dehydrogenase
VITKEITSAPALVAGEWMRDGPWMERTGPYLRRVVARAVAATPDDVTQAVNAPANLLAHKPGASFATGNTTIVKTPPQAPASSAAIVELLLDAGLPAATGTAVARAAGRKRLVLELGGNAATIVCEDADIPAAARICARTGYTNSGQSCISVQRVYVQRDRFGEFTDALAAEAAKLRTGDPLDDATDVGSMVDEEAAERVVRWTAEAADGGADIVLGGTRDGATMNPTVVANPPATASVVVHEVFGALVAVLPYDSFGEVIETCNASRYGLQAGLFTRDIGRVLTAWRELQVGGLVVNGSSNFRLDHVPFGGVKDSGFGRESPRWMIDDYTVVKTLLLRGFSVFGEEGA